MVVKNQRKHVAISVPGQSSKISVVRGEEKTNYVLWPRQWDTVALGEVVQNLSKKHHLLVAIEVTSETRWSPRLDKNVLGNIMKNHLP